MALVFALVVRNANDRYPPVVLSALAQIQNDHQVFLDFIG